MQFKTLLLEIAKEMLSKGFSCNEYKQLEIFLEKIPNEDHAFASPMNSRSGFFAFISKRRKAGDKTLFNDDSVYQDGEFLNSHGADYVNCPHCGAEYGTTQMQFQSIPGYQQSEGCTVCDTLFGVELRQDFEGNMYVWTYRV